MLATSVVITFRGSVANKKDPFQYERWDRWNFFFN